MRKLKSARQSPLGTSGPDAQHVRPTLFVGEDLKSSLEMVVNAAKHFLRRPVAFFPALAELGGSIESGLFLSQACYWTPRTHDEDGWFYKTQGEWKIETVLSRRQQEHARRQLTHRGLLEEKLKGVPARLYFRVNWERLQGALGDLESVQSSMAESAKQESAKQPIRYGGNSQPLRLTESTQETTQRKTRAQSRSARNRFDDEQEQRRRIAAQANRLKKEEETRREIMVGVGPR
jgi:hypothetical protein